LIGMLARTVIWGLIENYVGGRILGIVINAGGSVTVKVLKNGKETLVNLSEELSKEVRSFVKAANKGDDHAVRAVRKLQGVAPRNGGGIVPTVQGNVPQADKWIRGGGRVIYGADGSMTYIKNGVSIRYNSVGYPDFSKQLYKGTDGLSQVRINLTGSRRLDEAAANAAAGFKQTPDGFIWHHHEDLGLMQLVDEGIHGSFWHSGGFSLIK